MKLTIPNEGDLDPRTVMALRAVVDEVSAAFATAHGSDNRTMRTLLQAYHSTTQSLPDSTWTALNFNAERDLRGVPGVTVPSGVHSKTSRTDRFIVPETRAGLIRIRARCGFAANATGARGLIVTVNGTQVGGFVFVQAAAAVGATTIETNWETVLTVGDELGVQAYQNSGGALNAGSASAGTQNECTVEFP